MEDEKADALRRRWNELLALRSILGEDLLEVSPAELASALDYTAEDDAALPAAVRREAQLSVRAACGAGRSVRLLLTLPPGYPAPAFTVLAQPADDSGSGAPLPRGWLRACAALLGERAAEAAEQGRECLFDLVELLRAELAALPRPAAEPAGAAPAAASSSDGRAAAPLREQRGRVLLARIDHMRDAARYRRTLSSWVRELRLGGALALLPPQLLLLAVEGTADQLAELRLRLRTRVLDVDSRGRPCKERQLRLIAEGAAPSPGALGGGPGTLQELRSLQEVRAAFAVAGLQAWFREATGLEWEPPG